MPGRACGPVPESWCPCYHTKMSDSSSYIYSSLLLAMYNNKAIDMISLSGSPEGRGVAPKSKDGFSRILSSIYGQRLHGLYLNITPAVFHKRLGSGVCNT